VKFFNFINSAYKGDEKLWKVFVFGWVIPLIPITIATQILFKELPVKHPEVDYSNLIYGSVVFLWCYYFWLGLSIWKCSKNSKIVFKLLSRLFTIICFISLFAAGRSLVTGQI
jgi:hypothetical protein